MNAEQTRNKYTAESKRFFDFIKIPGNTMEEQYRFTIQMKRERMVIAVITIDGS